MVDGDVFSIISWETAEHRKRVFETLGVERVLIDTFRVSHNYDIGPNNNSAVLLYKGFSKPIKLKKLSKNKIKKYN